MIIHFVISLGLTILTLYYMRRDNIFSPFKFMVIINSLYLLLPIGLVGVFNFQYNEFAKVFPSLYNSTTNNFMLYIYDYFTICLLCFKLFKDKENNLSQLKNDVSDLFERGIFALTSIFFICISFAFLFLAIAMVGLDAYMSYSVDATIGGDVVAQSFKSQGEMMLALFSLPILRILFKEKRYLLLTTLFVLLIGVAMIGGARKFLVFPLAYLLYLMLEEFGIKDNLKKYALFGIGSVTILTIIQSIRDNSENILDFSLVIKTLFHQFGFAYLVPNAFVYNNYNLISFFSDFSVISFIKQIFNPVVFSIPRFILPTKDELLFRVNSDFTYDYHTVGGESFIEYFLSNSIIALLIFYPIFCLLLYYLYKMSQSRSSTVFHYIYFGSLISLVWFNFNWGYVVSFKVFLIQILLSFLAFYFVSKIITKYFLKNKNQKKIFINGRFFSQKITGVQRVAIETLGKLDLLIGEGHLPSHVKIIILCPKNAITDDFRYKNIEIRKVGKLTGHFWEQIELPIYSRWSLLVNFCNTAPVTKRNQVVIIHDAAVYGFPEAYSKSFRMVYKVIYNLVSNNSKKILTVSQFSKMELIKYLKINSEKVDVISLGSDHINMLQSDPSFEQLHSLEQTKYLLAVSSINPNKNFSAIMKALELLENNNDYKVFIAGGSDLKVFGNVGLADSKKINYLGYVTDEQLKSLYKYANCFIFPSFYEGFGLPPIEAMSQGCPVIVSDRASMPEVCKDAALYIDPNKPEEIANQIKAIMTEDKLRENLRIKSIQRANEYTWKRTASEILESIKEVM